MSNAHVSFRAAALILALAQSACDGEATAPVTFEPYEGEPVNADGTPAQAGTRPVDHALAVATSQVIKVLPSAR